MLVIDMSGSLRDLAFLGSTTTKWGDLLAALADPANGFLNANRDLARFGLELFPSSDACEPGAVVVPLSPDHDKNVVAELQRTVVGGGAPVALSLAVAGGDSRLVREENGRARFGLAPA